LTCEHESYRTTGHKSLLKCLTFHFHVNIIVITSKEREREDGTGRGEAWSERGERLSANSSIKKPFFLIKQKEVCELFRSSSSAF
jgi:hypothetical protein